MILCRVYKIAMSAMTVLTGVCLAVACVDIYRAGEGFSADAVADRFSVISPAVYIWLALVVIGVVLHFALPEKASRGNLGGNTSAALKRMYGKLGDNVPDAARKEQQKRKLFYAVGAILLTLGSVAFLVYSLNGDNYSHDMNASVKKTVFAMLLCLLLPFVWAVISYYLCTASRKRELALLKALKPDPTKTVCIRKGSREELVVSVVRGALLVLGTAFLVYGICTDGVSAVLTKAVNICTECIGLG